MRRPWALVPVKDPARGKSRLAPLLDADSRYALNLFLARQTLEVCSEFFGARRTLVVTTSAAVAALARALGAGVIPEAGDDGLNGALAAAAHGAIDAGADAVAVVPVDLALISHAALWDATAAMPDGPGCLLVPDRRGSGTNLLVLSPARSDLFAFGDGSLQRHAALAAARGCRVRIQHSDDLALDLDLPEDYRAWTGTGRTGAGASLQPAFAS